MSEIFNPYNRPDLPQPVANFLAEAREQILAQVQGKDFVFFGDLDHFKIRDTYIFLFSRAVLQALHDAGVRSLMLERGGPENQIFLDAVFDGALNPLNYAKVMYPMAGGPLFDADEQFELGAILAEGIKFAASLGMRFYTCDQYEGTLTPQESRTYVYFESRRNQAWLEYTLEQPDYFDDPERLATYLVRQNSHRYRTQRIDLASRRIKAGSDRDFIYQFWHQENRAALPQANPSILRKLDGTGKQLQGAIDSGAMVKKGLEPSAQLLKNNTRFRDTLKKRMQADHSVFDLFERLRGGQLCAVEYGGAHIRNLYGGFTSFLKPDQYVTFMFINAEETTGLLESEDKQKTIAPSDLVIFTRQGIICRYDELSVPRRQGLQLRRLPSFKEGPGWV